MLALVFLSFGAYADRSFETPKECEKVIEGPPKAPDEFKEHSPMSDPKENAMGSFLKSRILSREQSLEQVSSVYKLSETPEMGIEYTPQQFAEDSENPFGGIIERSEEFFAHTFLEEVEQHGGRIAFTSNLHTNVPENNVVCGMFFPARNTNMATIILPNWNAEGESFDRMARLFAICGVSALRISLPYHDCRQPTNWPFAKHMVSSNIGRTIQSVRQAVLDVRCGIDWLVSMGYKKIAIVGASIGSCVATIAAAHDNRVNGIVQLLMASNFAEAVWTGIATRHIRESFESLDGFTDLVQLKHLWAGISPDTYVSSLSDNDTKVLMVTGRYDPVFLPHLAEEIADHYTQYSVEHKWKLLSCGHYTFGDFPYNAIATMTALRWLRKVLQ